MQEYSILEINFEKVHRDKWKKSIKALLLRNCKIKGTVREAVQNGIKEEKQFYKAK